MSDPTSTSSTPGPAGFVEADGTRKYYTSALTDNATWVLEYLRMLHAARVSGSRARQGVDVEACPACAEHKDDDLKIDTTKHHFGIVAWFYEGFRQQFNGRNFNDTPVQFWAEMHRKGMEELSALGLVEGLVKETTTQLWVPRRVWFSRVVPGTIELKEG